MPGRADYGGGVSDPIVDPRLAGVVDLLEAAVADGTERGASLCVIEDGEVLLDVWAGWADPERTVAWQADTLTPIWSLSKTVVALAALTLHDRGGLDLEAPVAQYWPEFAAAGKELVTVAMLLSHSSGVAGWDPPVTVDDLYDWPGATAALAAQAPWWTPGDGSGYHLLNQGHLIGEVIRRVSGQPVGEFIAAEITGPLGADLHLGLPPDCDERVSPISPPRPIDVDLDGIGPEHPFMRAMTGPFLPAREANTERWRRGAIPAANGHGNARSVAQVNAVVSHGGEFAGHRLLSARTIDLITEVRADGIDRVLDVPLTFGLGWALPNRRVMPSVSRGHRCYWGGLGGSVVINDLERRRTVAYVMNRMIFEPVPGLERRRVRPVGDSRSDTYFAVIDEALR